MSRRSWLPGLALVLMLLTTPPALAADDPLVPGRPDGAPAYGQAVPLYDDPRFTPWHYTFEGQDWNRADYATIYFWMNQLQVTKAWSLKMALRTVEFAVRGDLITPLLDDAGAALDRLWETLWSSPGAPLVAGALALVGLWTLLLYLRSRTNRAWATLGGTLLILLLVGLVAAGGMRALNSIVALSRGVAVELFQSVSDATRGSDQMDLIARSGDSAWRVLVYEPWLTGELSEIGRSAHRSPDGLDGGNFLAMTPTQRHNVCLYSPTQAEVNCPWWGVDYLPRRMLIAAWTAAAGLVVAGVMALLAGSIILEQLTLVLFLALAPVWLLVALWWPESGVRLVRGVVMKGFAALVGQGMLAAVLACYLSLIQAVHASFAAGWMLQSVLLLGLSVLAFRYRYAVWQPLAVFAGRLQQRLEHGAQERAEPDARAAQPMIPAFGDVALSLPAVPESLVVLQQPAPRARAERPEPARPSQVESFHTQIERVQREITVRRQMQVYKRTLERIAERSQANREQTPATPAPIVPKPAYHPTPIERRADPHGRGPGPGR